MIVKLKSKQNEQCIRVADMSPGDAGVTADGGLRICFRSIGEWNFILTIADKDIACVQQNKIMDKHVSLLPKGSVIEFTV